MLTAEQQHPGVLVLAGDMRLDGVADGGLEIAFGILERRDLEATLRFPPRSTKAYSSPIDTTTPRTLSPTAGSPCWIPDGSGRTA
jgi:hypothetical protein